MRDRYLDFGGPFEGILGLGRPSEEGPDEFLARANVSSFSMCFNDRTPGALIFNPDFTKTTMLPNIGHSHWGLGLYGITAGSAEAPASFCTESEMDANQTTP